MTEETEFPKSRGNGNSTRYGWSVEARVSRDPVALGDQIFDTKWRTVSFVQCDFGVPTPRFDGGHGLFGYAQAQALLWWVHANDEAARSFSSIETRIVKHEIKENYSVTAISGHVEIGPEDRSNILPDWGKKSPTPKPEPETENDK